MITVKLQGGTGNQLYQYSLGRALGQTHEVQFDTSLLGPDKHRQYGLENLGLSLPLGKGRGKDIVEKSLRYDPGIFNVQGDATLHGYWQSPKYFEKAKGRILSVVFSGMVLGERAKELANILLEQNYSTCFIHVRRGDYLKEPHASFHGNLDMSYYESGQSLIERIWSTSMIGQVCSSVKYYVFSDDPEWCLQQFPPWFNVVEGMNEFESLYLMSLCRNAIIANSSFSFWGAWLGLEQRGGMVIAPKNWFKDPNPDSTDIVPERWIKI